MRNRSIRITWLMFSIAFGALLAATGPAAASTAAAQSVTKQRPARTQPAQTQPAQTQPAQTQEVLDLNSATEQQLTTLPGIGPEKARAIIARRERRPFERIEEILRVKGIGRATFRRLRSRITVRTQNRRPQRRRR